MTLKKTLLSLAIATSALAFGASEAFAIGCVARSPTGSYGYSTGYSTVAQARRRALYECAIRTPRGYYCRITRCSY
jgi:hypothetical protein